MNDLNLNNMFMLYKCVCLVLEKESLLWLSRSNQELHSLPKNRKPSTRDQNYCFKIKSTKIAGQIHFAIHTLLWLCWIQCKRYFHTIFKLIQFLTYFFVLKRISMRRSEFLSGLIWGGFDCTASIQTIKPQSQSKRIRMRRSEFWMV